jgi:gas vesicle protein
MTCSLGCVLVLLRHPSGVTLRSRRSLKNQYVHNVLCCIACIGKIKKEGFGQHTDCDVCLINDIIKEKKDKLKENIKCLEDLSNNLEQSIEELKKLFEIFNKKKEELKLEIQKVFTKIRNSVNQREDELLLKVDQQYSEFFLMKI